MRPRRLVIVAAALCCALLAGCELPAQTARRPGDADTAGVAPITPVIEAPVEPSGTIPGQAEGVGMLSHKGDELWLVVAASAYSEGEAHRLQRALAQALGDRGAAYVVDRSEHYSGMEPGQWIVVVGTESRAGALEEAAAARRDVFKPSVTRATKNCDDPIVVVPK